MYDAAGHCPGLILDGSEGAVNVPIRPPARASNVHEAEVPY